MPASDMRLDLITSMLISIVVSIFFVMMMPLDASELTFSPSSITHT